MCVHACVRVYKRVIDKQFSHPREPLRASSRCTRSHHTQDETAHVPMGTLFSCPWGVLPLGPKELWPILWLSHGPRASLQLWRWLLLPRQLLYSEHGAGRACTEGICVFLDKHPGRALLGHEEKQVFKGLSGSCSSPHELGPSSLLSVQSWSR